MNFLFDKIDILQVCIGFLMIEINNKWGTYGENNYWILIVHRQHRITQQQEKCTLNIFDL